MPHLASYHYKKKKGRHYFKCNKNHPLCTQKSKDNFKEVP